ncbi:MAG: hypothetical protein OXN83_00275 [Oligoflexia bacterium]|nr:hypothetical protein [Oligoflexia bacterium]
MRKADLSFSMKALVEKPEKNMGFLKAIFLSFFLSFPSHSNQGPLIIVASDFDGTITQLADHNFLTAVTLTRTDHYKDSSFYAIEKALHPYHLTFDHLPYSLEITQEEDLFFRDLFNKDGIIPNYRVLELEPVPGLESRKTKQIIIPGLYHIEYRADFKEDHFLLQDYKKSKRLAQKRGLKLSDLFNFGLDLINANLNRENSEIIIHTARGQSSSAFKELFSEMQKDKILTGSKEDLNKITIFPMSRPEAVAFGADFRARKIELLEQELKTLELYLRSEPYKEVHVVFAEDELKYLYAIHGLFEKVSKTPHLNKVYLHVLFTGPTELLKRLEVQNNKRFVTYLNGIQSEVSPKNAQIVGLPLKRMHELSGKLRQFNQSVSHCKKSFIKGK